jgi:hypothetical protein
VEFPFPALVAADLHGVVSRVPCPVTCALCLLHCARESNPALPARQQKVAGFPPLTRGYARLRSDYLLHPVVVHYSTRSNCQLDCWMRTSSSRICRARSSACAIPQARARGALTGGQPPGGHAWAHEPAVQEMPVLCAVVPSDQGGPPAVVACPCQDRARPPDAVAEQDLGIAVGGLVALRAEQGSRGDPSGKRMAARQAVLS